MVVLLFFLNFDHFVSVVFMEGKTIGLRPKHLQTWSVAGLNLEGYHGIRGDMNW